MPQGRLVGLQPLAEYRKKPGGPVELVREYIYAGDRLVASYGLEPVPLPSVTWTDDPLVPGTTVVKAVHLTELRDAVNAARTAHGLSAVTWTETVTPEVTPIKAVHIAELRDALAAVYTHAGVTAPTYTDATLTQEVTVVKAVHLTELRAARVDAPAGETLATRYYHLDALGSVRAVSDGTPTTVRRHDYAAFGEEPTPAPGGASRRFTGKERDTETGLDYFSARYYAAGIGRFTSSDDSGYADGYAPQSFNRFGFTLANPLR